MNRVEQIRARRPGQAKVALILSIVAVVLWVPLVGYLMDTGQLALLLLLLYLTASFGAAKGRQAARILVTIAVALLYVTLLPYCWLGFSDEYLNGPGYAVMDIIAVLLSGTSVVLLYLPSSNTYFSRISTARREDPA